MVLASQGYAVGGFLVKHRLGHAPPIGVAAWVMVAGTIWLLPAALITAPGSVPDLGPLAAVTALGVVGTGLAFAIFYTLIGRVGPARSFIVSYLAPGFAVVYGALLLDERITAATVAGLALVLTGSWLAVEGAPPCAGGAPQRRRHPVALLAQLGAQRVEDATTRAGPIASAHSKGPRGQLKPRRIAVSTSSGASPPPRRRRSAPR